MLYIYYILSFAALPKKVLPSKVSTERVLNNLTKKEKEKNDDEYISI